MKKAYTKPVFSCEYFEVNTNIAVGCETTVNFGPYDPTGKNVGVCEDYVAMFGMGDKGFTGHKGPQDGNFYPGHCDCYLTAIQRKVFTS